ncbi:hypothetical protein [Marinobacter sp. ELB17]|uniref:hypothetical protein n=1 Tax=Marinobacter sp. ELB17 TaxID=270374 RepID=UPI0000F3757E|nr:hypothetical protein [Marinobacter sp. ELB17]EBA00778.1 hypothetical protein MELB17_23115 [Marinobacter sp. ELB17]
MKHSKALLTFILLFTNSLLPLLPAYLTGSHFSTWLSAKFTAHTVPSLLMATAIPV